MILGNSSSAGGNSQVDTQGAYIVATVADLATVPSSVQRVFVSDIYRGGMFSHSNTGTVDNGTVFAGSTGYWVRDYDKYIYANWFGTTTSAYQSAMNYNKYVILDGDLYVPSATLCMTLNYQEVICVGSFTPTTYPIITIGQTTGGAVVANVVVNPKINGFYCNDATNSKVAGSGGIFIRKAAGVELVDISAYGLDKPIAFDGAVGGYESLGCRLSKLDLRRNNYGIYDPNGAMQASDISHSRIESNVVNFYVNSKNVTISQSILEGSTTADYQFGSLAGTININSAYSEDHNGTIMLNASPTLCLNINGGFYYGNSTTPASLINSSVSLSQGFINLNGAFFDSNFTGIFNNTMSGNSSFTAISCEKLFTNTYINGITFSSGASYNVFDRANGLSTNVGIASDAKITAKGGLILGANTTSKDLITWIGVGNYSTSDYSTSWNTITPMNVFSAVPQLIKLVLIGRESSTVTHYSELRCLVRGDLVTIDTTSLISDFGMSGVTPTIQIASGNLQVNNLNRYTTWVCHIGTKAFGYSL
jgi:hypothetical protein